MSTQIDTAFKPEPTQREVRYTVISVDDHLVEPAHLFEGRLPADLQSIAPRIELDQNGREAWNFDGKRIGQPGVLSSSGRQIDPFSHDVANYDEMRPGCYDVDARIHDMDINGVWASLSFPSEVAGFC